MRVSLTAKKWHLTFSHPFLRAAEGGKLFQSKCFLSRDTSIKKSKKKKTHRRLLCVRERNREMERERHRQHSHTGSPESVEIRFRKTLKEEKFFPVMQHPHGSPQQLLQQEAATEKQAHFLYWKKNKSMENSDHLSAPSLGKIDERQY